MGDRSVEFTRDNWSVAQTVTVSAGQDDDALEDTAVLRHGAQGGDYTGVQGPAVTVTVDDNDMAAVSVSPTSLGIAEGRSDTYTVVLTSKPTAAVTVTVGGTAGTDLTVSDTSLEFTRDNWDVAQTVTVSAGQDDDALDDTAVLRHGAQGGDYTGVQGPAMTVTVQDDDMARVSGIAWNSPRELRTYTVVLTSSDTGDTVRVLTSELTFTALRLGRVTVTVRRRIDDALDEGWLLRHGAQGGDYSGGAGLGSDGDGGRLTTGRRCRVSRTAEGDAQLHGVTSSRRRGDGGGGIPPGTDTFTRARGRWLTA